jgi:hypothetical protein
MKGYRAEIGRRCDRLDVVAALLPGELDEVAEKVLRKMLPPRGRSHGDRVHISNWLGLRDKTK